MSDITPEVQPEVTPEATSDVPPVAVAPVVKTGKKIFTGEVVSDKMNKTIVVAITSRRMHPLYKKYVVHTKKLKAHDETNDAHTGDTVRVIESKPISKEKRWRLLEIVERAK